MKAQKPFWKRILERHQYRRRLLRARVPLVLFRAWSAMSLPSQQVVMQSYVVRYPFQLQIQFCWPASVRVHGPYINLQQFSVTRSKSSTSHNVFPQKNESSRSTFVINTDREVVREVVQPGQPLPGMAAIEHTSRPLLSALADVTRSKEAAAPREFGSVPPAITSETKQEPPIVAEVISKTNAVDSTVLVHRSESLPSALVSGPESVPTAVGSRSESLPPAAEIRSEVTRNTVVVGSAATRNAVIVKSGATRSALVERSQLTIPVVVVRSKSAPPTIVDRSWLMPALMSKSVSTIANWNVTSVLHKESRASLCNLGVLGASVVDEFRANTHHRVTAHTEGAQRKQVASSSSTHQMLETVLTRNLAADGGGGFARHDLLPAPREFLSSPTPRENQESSSTQPAPIVTQRAAVPSPQPPMDVGRLSEEVYRHIQRKIRIERERRGL